MATTTDFPAEQRAGRFERQPSAFRDRVRADGTSDHAASHGRYHLYVSLACPWAHRTIIVRRLKGLEDAIGLTLVDPIRDERGWRFGDEFPDPLHGWSFLSEAYTATDPSFEGRITVPVLWDKETGRIVNNESADIVVDLATQFDAHAGDPDLDLYPEHLRAEIDELNAWVYETVNNGVYRSGFATTQEAYEEAVVPLFESLQRLDDRLADGRPFLFGEDHTLADWRLFTTLVRFDAVYVGHFKCNLRRVADFDHLEPYLERLLAIDGVAETVDLDQIKRHYYGTHRSINPSGIVPLGPELAFG
jgi:putative glutathione S-transferase